MKASSLQKLLWIPLLAFATSQAVAVSTAASQAGTAHKSSAKTSGKEVKLIDINSASKKELMTLPGIDAKTAERIIAGRPYLSKAFLVTNKVIPEGIYFMAKDRIIAKQK